MSDKSLAQEAPPPGEAACIQNLAERLKAKIIHDNPTGTMRRDAHPKMHGVVKAEFTIEPGLPDALRVGIFAEPVTYRAWIRFSNQNGTISPDIHRDLRGMAIKLMGVPGEKLLQQEKHEQTQDFILISANAFVTRDVEEFDTMIQALTGSTWAKVWFFGTHWRVTWNLIKSMKRCANPLQIRYFSTTPYLLGTNAVKYAVIPQFQQADTVPDKPDDNFLRDAMIRELAQRDVVFDFAVQLQIDADEMPIENPAKAWSESRSPFRKVARIRVLRQEFDSDLQREFGDNLSFTPWHSLPQHRPLGGINRARKVVYQVISQFRHQQNHMPGNEPTSWDIAGSSAGDGIGIAGDPPAIHTRNAAGITPIEIPGFDTSATLRQLGDDVALYHELIELLVPSIAKALEKFDAALARNDAAAIRSVLHLVRGMASNVGANELIQAATQLETAMQGLDSVPQQCADFRSLLERSLFAVQHAVRDNIRADVPL